MHHVTHDWCNQRNTADLWRLSGYLNCCVHAITKDGIYTANGTSASTPRRVRQHADLLSYTRKWLIKKSSADETQKFWCGKPLPPVRWKYTPVKSALLSGNCQVNKGAVGIYWKSLGKGADHGNWRWRNDRAMLVKLSWKTARKWFKKIAKYITKHRSPITNRRSIRH